MCRRAVLGGGLLERASLTGEEVWDAFSLRAPMNETKSRGSNWSAFLDLGHLISNFNASDLSAD